MDNNNTIFEKKMNDEFGYDKKLYNFACVGEYTVTITLAEYRELVQKSAAADARVSDANRELFELKAKHNDLLEKYRKLSEDYVKIERTLEKECRVPCKKERD